MMANPEQAWFLYIIRMASGHYYTGITTDVSRRFAEHQSGSRKAAKSLKGKGPLKLVFTCWIGSRGQALRTEVAVKKLTRAQKDQVIRQQSLPSHLTSL